MIYVMSDIHGRIDLFEKMLNDINFSKNDKLYVLGDCIDRGGGLKVLLKIMELHKQGQCELLWGNHEYIFVSNHQNHMENSRIAEYQREVNKRTFAMNTQRIDTKGTDSVLVKLMGLAASLIDLSVTANNSAALIELQSKINKSLEATEMCHNADEWETFKDMDDIPQETLVEMFEFLSECVFEKYIEVGDKPYLLIHGGLHETELYQLFVRDEFFMNPVDKELLANKGYREDTTVIFGHTTTRDINIMKDGKYIAPNKIWYDEDNKDKIGIDCGASFPNGQLGCLRLDDMKEFYVKNEQIAITPIEKIGQFFEEFKFEEDEQSV